MRRWVLKHTQPHAKHTFVILPDLRGTKLPKKRKIKTGLLAARVSLSISARRV